METENWELGTGNCLVVVGKGGAIRGLLTDQVIPGEMRGLQINQFGRGVEGGWAIKNSQRGGYIIP